jgi:hypothetical protein
VTSGTGFETVNAILQGLHGGNKRGNLSLELNDSLRSGGIAGAGFGAVLLREREVRRGAEKMGVAGFARARLAREDGGQRAGRIADFVGGRASGQALEGGLDGGEVVEGVEAVGAAAEFTGGLWAAEHEEAKDGGLVAAKIEDGADPMLVLGDAGIADGGDESEVLKRMERLANLVFGEVENGVAAGALVARVKQSVEGKRVVLWRGDLFFDERAEDSELMGREMHRYKGATGEGPVGRADNEETYAKGQVVISQ